jgi:hypothetical protein
VISLAVSFQAATVLFLVAERGYFYNQRLAGRVRFQAAVVMPAACVVVLMFCSPEIIASVRDRFPTLPMAYNQDNKFRGVQVSGTGQGQQRDGALVIDSFDIDPQILLPALPASLNHSPVLSVELGVSADTYFQVFYQADPNRCYTEAESSRLPLHRGKNTVKVNLPPSAAGTRLRIDPMARPGQVAIRSITIR